MLRQGDAAAGDNGDIISFTVFDQGLVNLADHVLDEHGAFRSDLPAVHVGDDMDDFHIPVRKLDGPLHPVGRQFNPHGNDDPGMDLLQFPDPALHVPIILYFRKPRNFQYFLGKHYGAGCKIKGDVGQDFFGILLEEGPFLRIHDGDEIGLHRRLCDHGIELREGILLRKPVDDQGHRNGQDRRQGRNHFIAARGEESGFLPDIDGAGVDLKDAQRVLEQETARIHERYDQIVQTEKGRGAVLEKLFKTHIEKSKDEPAPRPIRDIDLD